MAALVVAVLGEVLLRFWLPFVALSACAARNSGIFAVYQETADSRILNESKLPQR